MPCYKPLKAYKALNRFTETGKNVIIIGKDGPGNEEHQPVELPCGQCIGCRIDKSREWAMRCVHEASLHKDNCFITLTFNEENYPKNGSLVKSDFQKFMKRLRKRYTGERISYFHCGEYGENLERPHHHACIFGFDFPDKVLYNVRDGIKLYRSAILEELWPLGFCTIGDVTFESAAYVARYCTKKITGDRAAEHYVRYSEEEDELYYVEPEYITMSRRPAIGKNWHQKFASDTHKNFLTRNGKKVRVPRYYDKLLEVSDPEMLRIMKLDRQRRISCSDKKEKTMDRRVVVEECKNQQVKRLKRGIE